MDCLDSEESVLPIQKDLKDADRYGVSGTPTFFINGRLLSGAQSYEKFARIIDEELDAPAP